MTTLRLLLLNIGDIGLGICNAGLETFHLVFHILNFQGKLTALEVNLVYSGILELNLIECAELFVHSDAVGIIHALGHGYECFLFVDGGYYCLFYLFFFFTGIKSNVLD